MLELVPPGLNIDFLGKAKLCITISAVVILIGLASIVFHGGFNEGIDFSGGTLLQLRFSQPAVLGEVREALGEVGLGKSIVQHFGDQHEVLIRTGQPPTAGQDIGQQVQKIAAIPIRHIDNVTNVSHMLYITHQNDFHRLSPYRTALLAAHIWSYLPCLSAF